MQSFGLYPGTFLVFLAGFILNNSRPQTPFCDSTRLCSVAVRLGMTDMRCTRLFKHISDMEQVRVGRVLLTVAIDTLPPGVASQVKAFPYRRNVKEYFLFTLWSGRTGRASYA